MADETSVAGAGAEVPQTWSKEQRKEALAREIQKLVAQGAHIEIQSDYEATLYTNHRLNSVLGHVWIGLAIFGGPKRMSVSVDEYGHTNVSKL